MRPGKKDNSLATLTIVIPHPMLQHHPTPQRGVVTSCDTPTARLTSTHTTWAEFDIPLCKSEGKSFESCQLTPDSVSLGFVIRADRVRGPVI